MEDFNPDTYLADKTASDTGFNPDQYIANKEASAALIKNREAIEPGIMGETEPVESKLLGNTISALSGATMPSAVTGLVKAPLNIASQYAKRFGQNQAMKAMGAAGGQIGQAGIPESRAIAQSMIDQGVVSPLRGSIGMEEKINQLSNQTGANIGVTRAAADKTGGAPSMAEILQKIKQDLIDKYSSGLHKGEMGGLNKAREEIAKGGTGTFTGNAQKATDLNQFATKQRAIMRPDTAATDVADTITSMNKGALQKVLTPEQWAAHEKDLANYGPLQTAKKFMERGERKEMSGHGGATFTKAIADKTMDALGNRTAATVGSHLGDVLQSAATTPFNAKALIAYLEELDANKQP